MRVILRIPLFFVFCLPALLSAQSDTGKAVYQQCAGCHGAAGQGSAIGPPLKGLNKKKSLARGGAPTDANLKRIVQKGVGSMPGFPHVDGSDWTALLAFLKKL